MTSLLLVVIYIAYIGLGLPDSMLGTAWPAIYPEFEAPVSAVSLVTVIISLGTVISSFFSAKVISRFGTGKVAAVSTAMTAAALFGFSVSGSLWSLCLCAVPLGLGAGSIDTALNNYAALHYSPVHMNFLHCFYGVGVSLSPYLMSLALAQGNRWRLGYEMAFIIQGLIALITALSLPLWRKAQSGKISEEDSKAIPFFKLLKIPGIKAQYAVFTGSCGIESVCLVWGSTFLVNARGMTAEAAARFMTLYYVGLALGRFISGLLANKIRGEALIKIGQGITLAAVAVLLFFDNAAAAVVCLFAVGFGNGPVFPNMTHLTPETFGRDISKSVIGTQMAISYMSIMLTPVIFGFLAEVAGIELFPLFMLLMFAVMAFGSIKLKKQKYRKSKKAGQK